MKIGEHVWFSSDVELPWRKYIIKSFKSTSYKDEQTKVSRLKITNHEILNTFTMKKTFHFFISGRAEWNLFANRQVKVTLFFPLHDILQRFISLNLLFSALMGRNYPILCEHDQEFTISLNPIFHTPKFFRWVRSEKKSILGFFLQNKSCFFESCFYNELENANVFELNDRKPFSWAACSDASCQVFFQPVSL